MHRFLTQLLFLFSSVSLVSAQNLTFADSQNRHQGVSAVALDCSADYPVTAAAAGAELALTIWDKSIVLDRLDSVGVASGGPVAVASGQGVAQGPNFKVVTASVLPADFPQGLRGRVQLISWGIGNGQIARMRTRILQDFPANPDKLDLVWTSAGLVLGSYSTDGARLDLGRFDVNFVTGHMGEPAHSTITNVRDFALASDRRLPNAALAIRVNNAIQVQRIDPVTGTRTQLFNTPATFTLPNVSTLQDFDVGILKTEGTGDEIVRLIALDDTARTSLITNAGAGALTATEMQSVSLVMGLDGNIHAVGQRVLGGRFVALNGRSDCNDTIGQPATSPVGCYIDGDSARLDLTDDLIFTAKMNANDRMRLTSWNWNSCGNNTSNTVIVAPFFPNPALPAATFTTAATPVTPIAGATCEGNPGILPVVNFRWTPSGAVAGSVVNTDYQVEVQAVGAGCPVTPAAPPTARNQAPVFTADNLCILIDPNTNDWAADLVPGTTYTWRVRAFNPDVTPPVAAPFSAPTTFTVGGPPATATFVAPLPEPQNNFPTQGKKLDLGSSRIPSATISIRWDPADCPATTFDGSVVAAKEIETGFDRNNDNVPDTRIIAEGGTFAGSCPTNAQFCEAHGIAVESGLEYLLQLSQRNNFGESLSSMTFSVK